MKDVCSSSATTIQCPDGYVIILVNVYDGVAQQPDSCIYTPEDCVADASTTITCATDHAKCSIVATKKKLPQCNDQYSSYLHIEYQCIPLSMDDPRKEYKICQNNRNVTSEQGIIYSSDYPALFPITAGECSLSIQVPDNKMIKLWLIDLYIGSSMVSNCMNDYVLVVDSARTLASTILSNRFNCNFEQGILCPSWMHDVTADFQWELIQGSTLSDETGPSVDHTLGTSDGWYIYMETSFPQQSNNTCRIISEPIRGPACLEFWYVLRMCEKHFQEPFY
ncbi:unnamed protein product [Rotaria sp. Silwood1]|nr:unnamed protein product [Rotaria sp. Silwood1]